MKQSLSKTDNFIIKSLHILLYYGKSSVEM